MTIYYKHYDNIAVSCTKTRVKHDRLAKATLNQGPPVYRPTDKQTNKQTKSHKQIASLVILPVGGACRFRAEHVWGNGCTRYRLTQY